MACVCRSSSRCLYVTVTDLPLDYPELVLLAPQQDWSLVPERDAFRVEVGGCSRWASAYELSNFLRGVLDLHRYQRLRARWEDSSGSPGQDAPLRLMDLARQDTSLLSRLLDQGRIETYFQPIVRAGTEGSASLWGYECLMRARDPEGGLIGAGTLAAWADQESLKFMLDRVCRETHLSNAGSVPGARDHFFTVNFMPSAIYWPEFCLRTSMAAATRSGLRPEQVYFEVVEDDVVRDPAHLSKILDYYRTHGFKVALDDMGSGYSSVALIHELRPDLVKLDRSLVAGAVDSSAARGRCEEILAASRAVGAAFLAEGVELEAEAQLMRELGVDLMQGFLFGRPAPLGSAPGAVLERGQ